MKIEPKYYIWENTPLKWYKFLVYFALVLGILSQSVYGINILLSGNAHWLDLLYSFISLGWLIFSEVQLANRKWSGAVAYCLYFIFQGVYYFIFTVLYISYGLSFSHLLSNVIAAFILVPILWVYFCKRRPLFSPWVDQHDAFVPTAASPAVENETSAFPEEAKSGQPSYSEPEKSRSTPEPEAPSLQQRIMTSRERIYRCCPQCGQLVPYIQTKCDCGYRFLSHISKSPKKETSHQKFLIGALGALCLFLCISLIYTFSQISNYRQEVTSLEAENSSLTEDVSLLSSDNAYLEEKVSNLEKSINLATNDYMTVFSENNDLRILLSTYYSGIGFIVEGSSYYHSIDCLNVTSASEYWAHNVEYCEYIGYQKCPYCFSNPDYS